MKELVADTSAGGEATSEMLAVGICSLATLSIVAGMSVASVTVAVTSVTIAVASVASVPVPVAVAVAVASVAAASVAAVAFVAAASVTVASVAADRFVTGTSTSMQSAGGGEVVHVERPVLRWDVSIVLDMLVSTFSLFVIWRLFQADAGGRVQHHRIVGSVTTYWICCYHSRQPPA